MNGNNNDTQSTIFKELRKVTGSLKFAKIAKLHHNLFAPHSHSEISLTKPGYAVFN